MAFMECTDEMYAHYGDLVDAKEKEFAEFPKDLKIKMQTSVTREEVARQRARSHLHDGDAEHGGATPS